MNVHVLSVLDLKISTKKVRLPVCLWVPSVDTISFEGVTGSKRNLVGVY